MGLFKCSYVPSKLIASSNLLGSKKAALAKTKSVMLIILKKAIQTLCIKTRGIICILSCALLTQKKAAISVETQTAVH